MLGEEIVRPGDWAVKRPGLPPGGWAFEFHNDNYPDIDDTAEVALALRRVRHHDPERVDHAVGRAVRWNLGMQSKNGAWGAFDVDNTSPFPNRLPFCDFGEVIDPPSADVTAHVVEMLAAEGLAHDPRARRGIAWLLAEQEANGSWFGRWGVNYIYGTGSVVPALTAAGLPGSHPAIRRAVAWLEGVQNDDGGWGEDLRSYKYAEEWSGHGASTASQTAWALMALLAAGEKDSKAVERGVRWLADTQREDGTWDEPYFTGTGFPWTSPSTTTCTGRSSRSPRSAGTCTATPSSGPRSPRPARPSSRHRGSELTNQPGPAPLLIACALGIEHLALRTGDRGGAGGPYTVVRTGMGPRAAERSVTGRLGDPALADAAVLATGFCAGLAPGMHPGDLVVAEETRDPRGTVACVGTELLVKELARLLPGRTVHTGPLTGSDHVVRGPERSDLLATGAIAVDMESAATLLSAVRAGDRPVAAVRVVVDAPEHELVRIGTVRGGISAFRVLRSVLPAFIEWHRSLLLPRR